MKSASSIAWRVTLFAPNGAGLTRSTRSRPGPTAWALGLRCYPGSAGHGLRPPNPITLAHAIARTGVLIPRCGQIANPWQDGPGPTL